MAQLVARLVRNEKVGGSNPPSSTTGRHPIAGVGFCVPGRVAVCLILCCLRHCWCSWRRTCCPVGRAARCARGRLPARSPSAPRASLGASPRCPARPRHRSPALRPGPAAAHGHLCLALPPPTGTAASPAHNASPAAASARSYVGVEPLFRAADHAEVSSHNVWRRGSASGLAAKRRAMTAPLNA